MILQLLPTLPNADKVMEVVTNLVLPLGMNSFFKLQSKRSDSRNLEPS